MPSDRRPLHTFAIVVGVIVGFTGSIITMSAVFGVASIVVEVREGIAIDEGVTDRWLQDAVPLLAFLAISVLWLVAGGFAAAKVATRDHERHGAWTGASALVLGLVTLALPFTAESHIPSWYNVLALVLTIPASILGAFLARRGNVGQTPPQCNPEDEQRTAVSTQR